MTIRPVDVARYIETRQQTHSAPDVKQPCVTCNSAAALKKLPHRAAASNVLIARKGKSEARIGIFNRDYGPTD
jgi:hypothetical protein